MKFPRARFDGEAGTVSCSEMSYGCPTTRSGRANSAYGGTPSLQHCVSKLIRRSKLKHSPVLQNHVGLPSYSNTLPHEIPSRRREERNDRDGEQEDDERDEVRRVRAHNSEYGRHDVS